MKLFKEGEKEHVGLFYLHSILQSSFALIWIYWIIFLMDQGFSFVIIGIALAVNGLCMTLLEVPTGALADAFGRKASTILGFVGFAAGMLIIPSITDPVLLIMVFAAWGLPITFISGAAEAWVVDNLKAVDREDLIDDFFAKDQSINMLGFIFASILAALVVKYWGMDMIWYISGISMLATIPVLMAQKEYFVPEKLDLKGTMKQAGQNIKEGARFSISEKQVLYLLIAILFIAIGSEFAMILRQPYMEDMGISREFFGYIAAIGSAICVGTPFLAKAIGQKTKNKNHYLAIHTLIFAAVMIAIIFVNLAWLAALVLIILSLRWSMFGPVFEPYFQNILPTEIRATMGSFRNMVFAAGLLIGDVILSLFTDTMGSGNMLVLGGLITLPAILYFFAAKNKGQSKNNQRL